MSALLNWMGVDVDWVNDLIVESSTANTSVISSNTQYIDHRIPCVGHGVWMRVAGCRVVRDDQGDDEEYVVYMIDYKLGQPHEWKKNSNITGEEADALEQSRRTRCDFRYSDLSHFHESLCESFVGLPIFPIKTLFNSTSQTFLNKRMNGLASYFRALLQRVDVMKACALAPLLKINRQALRQQLELCTTSADLDRKSIDASNTTPSSSTTPHMFDLTFVEESNAVLLLKKLNFAEKFNVMSCIEISRDVFAVAVGDHSALAQVDSFLEVVFGDQDERKRAASKTTEDGREVFEDGSEVVKYGAVYIFSVNQQHVFTRKAHYFFEAACQFMQYDPEKQLLFIANTDGVLYILSVKGGDENIELKMVDALPLYHDPFTCLSFEPQSHTDPSLHVDAVKSGSFILTCSEAGIVKAINVNSGAAVFEYRYENARIAALAYDPVHSRLFVGCYDRMVYVFSVATCFASLFGSKKPVPTNEYVVPEYVERIPTAASKKAKQTPKLVAKLSGHEGSVRGLIYHPESRMLYSCSFDGCVLGWLVPIPGHEEAMCVTASFLADQNTIDCMFLSDDGKVLVTGNHQGNALVWRVRDATVLFGVDCANAVINTIGVTQSGRLFTGGQDDALSLWKFDFVEKTV